MTDSERIIQLEARLAQLEARIVGLELLKPTYVPNPNWNDIQWYIPGNTPKYKITCGEEK
jgi:hypothetical protein